MNLIELFIALEEKIDEGQAALKVTSIESKDYTVLIENITATMGILRNADELYKHFSQFEKQDQKNQNNPYAHLDKFIGQEFEGEGKEADLIVFKSKTCGFCDDLSEILYEIEDSINIKFLDSDENVEETLEYEINAYPTMFYLKEGMIDDIEVGVTSYESKYFLEKIKK